jgi:hypothetical protein
LVTVSNVEDVVTEEVPEMPDAREEAGSIVLPDVPERTRSRSPRRGRPARAVWTEEETRLLGVAYLAYPGEWERMRRNYEPLRRFSGMQLKDKYRATFGNRARRG